MFEMHDPNVLYTDYKKQNSKGPRPRDLLGLANGYFGSDKGMVVNSEELEADSKLMGSTLALSSSGYDSSLHPATPERAIMLKLSEFQ